MAADPLTGDVGAALAASAHRLYPLPSRAAGGVVVEVSGCAPDALPERCPVENALTMGGAIAATVVATAAVARACDQPIGPRGVLPRS
jgi:hypothetical protein